jgi:hypothetical protein
MAIQGKLGGQVKALVTAFSSGLQVLFLQQLALFSQM